MGVEPINDDAASLENIREYFDECIKEILIRERLDGSGWKSVSHESIRHTVRKNETVIQKVLFLPTGLSAGDGFKLIGTAHDGRVAVFLNEEIISTGFKEVAADARPAS